MFPIKHFLLDLYIKNNDEEIDYKDIKCEYKNDKYIFNINEDEYEIEKTTKIVFHKKNKESVINFIFENNKQTTGTYYIKELDFYMDAKVKTVRYNINENSIEVEYKLWLQDEEIGNFIFKLRVKE